MAWLVRTRTAETAASGEPPVSRPRTGGRAPDADGDNSHMYRLVKQLEACVRTLEHENETTVMFKRDNPFVQAANRAFEAYKAEDDQSKLEIGPACHMTYAVLEEFKSWSPPDDSPRIKSCLRAVHRLCLAMEKGTGEDAAGWIKTFVCFPTIDKPGQPKRSRISFSVLGQTILFDKEEEENGAAGAEPQDDPRALPTLWLQAAGKVMDIQHILEILFRAAVGSVTASRAPRGNLARKMRSR